MSPGAGSACESTNAPSLLKAYPAGSAIRLGHPADAAGTGRD
jgi:hypothetical protein